MADCFIQCTCVYIMPFYTKLETFTDIILQNLSGGLEKISMAASIKKNWNGTCTNF